MSTTVAVHCERCVGCQVAFVLRHAIRPVHSLRGMAFHIHAVGPAPGMVSVAAMVCTGTATARVHADGDVRPMTPEELRFGARSLTSDLAIVVAQHAHRLLDRRVGALPLHCLEPDELEVEEREGLLSLRDESGACPGMAVQASDHLEDELRRESGHRTHTTIERREWRESLSRRLPATTVTASACVRSSRRNAPSRMLRLATHAHAACAATPRHACRASPRMPRLATHAAPRHACRASPRMPRLAMRFTPTFFTAAVSPLATKTR